MPPRYLQVFPSFLCDRQCSFCFNRGVEGGQMMGPEAAARLASIAASEGIAEADILGGEPTLYPHLEVLVGSFARQGVRMYLSSNGSAPRRLAGLSEAYPAEVLRVGVSLNGGGVDEELHRYITRFRPLLKGVCMKGGALQPPVWRYLELPGVTYYHLFMDTLRVQDLHRAMPYYAYREILGELRGCGGKIEGVACAGFVPEAADERELAGVRCPAGTTKLSIMPDGSVYPCYLLFRDTAFRLGNIFDDDFGRIWNHPALAFFRNFEGNPCRVRQCGYSGSCRGGCPAVALLLTGDLLSPDPRCSLPWSSPGEERAVPRRPVAWGTLG